MSKRKNLVQPDPVYGSTSVAKFINYVMRKGKKSVARKIVYDAFEIIKKKKKDPIEVFEEAIKNAAPILEVRPRRIGGATYQVPIEVKKDRRIALALRWIIEAARSKKGAPMSQKLANELLQAADKTGAAVRKRENVHRMAEANKAFARFAR